MSDANGTAHPTSESESSPAFSELLTTKLGSEGERLVLKRLKKIGVAAYRPGFSGAHPIDLMVLTPQGRAQLWDIKTTRIQEGYVHLFSNQIRRYRELSASTGLPVGFFILDPMSGECLSGMLGDVDEEGRINGRKLMHLFDLDKRELEVTKAMCIAIAEEKQVANMRLGAAMADAIRLAQEDEERRTGFARWVRSSQERNRIPRTQSDDTPDASPTPPGS